MSIDELIEESVQLDNSRDSSDELILSETYTESKEDLTPTKIAFLRRQLKYIIQLNKELNTYSYGIPMEDGTIVNPEDDEEFFNLYHYLSPEEFENNRAGICYDCAEYQYRNLSAKRFKVVNFYIKLKGGNTHTFTVVKFKDFYVYLESTFYKLRGVYITNHIADIFNIVINTMTKNLKTSEIGYEIHSYPGYDNYGCNINEFMNHMETKEKLITKGIAYPNQPKTTNIHKFDESTGFEIFGDLFTESVDEISEELLLFEVAIEHSFLLKEVVEKRIFTTLATPEQRRKYKRIQDEYINRNMDKLSTAGPMYLIVFGDNDQKAYFDLFGIKKEEIVEAVTIITKKASANSDFKFLRNNPILVVLYFCIRYFTLEKDEQGVNSTLGIFALGIYWSKFTKYFPKGVIGPVMDYTIDNMTEKFMVKKCGNIFNTLMTSIKQSYQFHKKRFYEGGDDDVVAFLQRISNDQNSLLKKIANEYMKNYNAGNAVTTRNDDYDPDNPIVDDVQNNSTIIQNQVSKVTLPIISNGVDLVLAEAAARMSKISISDCREYLTKIMVKENLPTLEKLIESILFLFIYTDQRSVREIKSQYFLVWAAALFRKTNSKDENLRNINAILEKWAEESGIYARYKREASRINYKKGIFFYVILSIQKYS